jgi:hypothetical protein
MRGEPSGPPPDFVAFVARRSAEVDRAARGFTGSDRHAGALHHDLLTSVALRWWWLTVFAARFGRVDAADGYLDRLMARERTQWDDPRPEVTVVSVARPPVTFLDRPLGPADLAGSVWTQARRTRRRRIFVVGAVGLLGLVLLVAPRTADNSTPAAPPAPPLPTVRPPLVDVVPVGSAFDVLRHQAVPALPATLDLDSAVTLGPLSRYPVHRAVGLFERPDRTAIYVLGDDGRLRSIDTGYELFSTSLSPDRTRAALGGFGQVTVVDLTTGAARAYPGDAPTAVVWLTGSTLLVATYSGSMTLDLVFGGTAESRYRASEVAQADASGVVAELVSPGEPATAPARVHVFAGGMVSDLPIDAEPGTGLPTGWLGTWLGPGRLSGSIAVRDCGADRLALPAADGLPRSATVAVDTRTGYIKRVLVGPGYPTSLGVLGFFDPQTVAVLADDGSAQTVLAWNWTDGQLRRVLRLTRDRVTSLGIG